MKYIFANCVTFNIAENECRGINVAEFVSKIVESDQVYIVRLGILFYRLFYNPDADYPECS